MHAGSLPVHPGGWHRGACATGLRSCGATVATVETGGPHRPPGPGAPTSESLAPSAPCPCPLSMGPHRYPPFLIESFILALPTPPASCRVSLARRQMERMMDERFALDRRNQDMRRQLARHGLVPVGGPCPPGPPLPSLPTSSPTHPSRGLLSIHPCIPPPPRLPHSFPPSRNPPLPLPLASHLAGSSRGSPAGEVTDTSGPDRAEPGPGWAGAGPSRGRAPAAVVVLR
jgi:hypothetical protein